MGISGALALADADFLTAADSLNRAIKLSPFDNMLYMWMALLASSCFGLSQYEEAINWARRAVQQKPSFGFAQRILAANLALAGRIEDAREITRNRDAVQKTTIRELRALKGFRGETLERYLDAQRIAGVAEKAE